jgi:hypothetical protein
LAFFTFLAIAIFSGPAISTDARKLGPGQKVGALNLERRICING